MRIFLIHWHVQTTSKTADILHQQTAFS